MNKLAKIAMAASVFMVPFAANATPVAGTYVDTAAQVSKGLFLTCVMKADLVDTGSGFQVQGITLTTGLCPLVQFQNQPYDVTYSGNGTGSYTIHDADVTTITSGDCLGDVSGTYDMTPGSEVIHIPYQTVPAKAGGGDCTIKADLKKI